MNIFGIRIITKKQYEGIKQKAYYKAVAELVELLKNKEKIYLAPVTIGRNATIVNCAFLGMEEGTALTVNDPTPRSKLKNIGVKLFKRQTGG